MITKLRSGLASKGTQSSYLDQITNLDIAFVR